MKQQWEEKSFIAKELVRMIKEKEILIPQYQRGQVWLEPEQEKLIDTIRRGFPFGTILLYLNEENKYRLIDGLQRCTTIAKYINNPSMIFNKDADIDEETLLKIINLVPNLHNQIKVYQNSIKDIIHEWVVANHKTMEDIINMQYGRCVRKIQEKFPIFNDYSVQIEDLLEPMLKNFKELCNNLLTAVVPSIVYKGKQENLPEIFTRINTEGRKLSRYQILAATWSHVEIVVDHPELSNIHQSVEEYFVTLLSDEKTFSLEETLRDENVLNLFQIIFGFSKMLSTECKYLFKEDKNSEIESAGFNLLTVTLGLRISEMKFLDKRIKDTFSTDSEFNFFLVKLLELAKTIDKLLRPYASFKLNSRGTNPVNIFHTEHQICSVVSNAFIVKHVTNLREDQKNIYQFSLERNTKEWDSYFKEFKENFLKRYIIDILTKYWGGSGDNKFYEVSKNPRYYTNAVAKEDLRNNLSIWHRNYRDSTNEISKPSNPSDTDKLILSIVYSGFFSSKQLQDDSKYDIEHLATKNLMTNHMMELGQKYEGLAVSSIGNLCLLPEYANRRKKELTIYQDKNYLEEVGKHDLTIKDIEDKYSFTSKEDLIWIENKFSTFDHLKLEFNNFIDKRFNIYTDIIINNLYNNKYK